MNIEVEIVRYTNKAKMAVTFKTESIGSFTQSEVETLKNNFVDKLKEELFGLEGDMLNIGTDAALSFISGWNETMGANDFTVGELLHSVARGTIDTAPKVVQLMEQNNSNNSNNSDISDLSKCLTDKAEFNFYLGTEKFADVIVNTINGKMIKCGKNILMN